MNILIFSPSAAVWPHEKPLLEYAQELTNLGHKVSVLRCNKHFSDFCISMSAFGLSFNSASVEKDKVCRRCIRSARYIDQVEQLESELIDDLDQYELQVTKLLTDVNEENWWEFEIDSTPIGRYAAYEFVLHNKLTSRVIPTNLFDEYLSSLKYTLKIYLYARDYFEKRNYDAILVYNRLYSLNKVFCEVGKSFGIPSYTVHASGSILNFFEKVSVFKDDQLALKINTSASWAEYSKWNLSLNEVQNVSEHFLGLFKAASPWVYSSKPTGIDPKKLRERIGAPVGSKIILLATSSVDEIFAIKMIGVDPVDINAPIIFESQSHWIESVVEFLSNRPDIFLIIRVHPREFANKRESLNSNHGKELKKLFETFKGSNFYLNIPGDGLALYDFLEITDLLLAGNSSAVPEFTALGVPVLCHESKNLTAFPREIAHWGQSKDQYFRKLDILLLNRVDASKSILAFRWFSFKINFIGEKTLYSNRGRNKFFFGLPRKGYSRFTVWLPLKVLGLLNVSWEKFYNRNPDSSVIERIVHLKLDGTLSTHNHFDRSLELEDSGLIGEARVNLLKTSKIESG